MLWPSSVDSIDWDHKKVHVDVTVEEVRKRPEFAIVR
jgi:hypothetical protein